MGIYVVLALVLYVLFDVNYFIQYILLIARGFLLWRHTKRPFLEPDVTTGMCSLSDLDHMIHMNNVKYLRAFEFGRAAFGTKNGLWRNARVLKAHLLISAQVVRYRRPVTLFQAFEIHSKVVYWEDRDIFIEQQMITVNDNFVRAVCLVKMTLVDGTLNDLLTSLDVDPSSKPMPVPRDIQLFIDYNRASSAKLNAQRDKLQNTKHSD
uniref:Protein THEM6 n=1 Tax=Rhipicephalus microplus TaxID=6941 RepID=A0A6G5AFI1_RHIMP